MDFRSDTELQDAKARMRPVAVELLHALRGGGIPNPMAALEQLSLLLLLLHLGPAQWSQLSRAPSAIRSAVLRDRIFPELLRRTSVGGQPMREAMQEATVTFLSPELLDLIVRRLEAVPQSEYRCADLLDAALDEVSATSSVGSPRTPIAVSDCMTALTEPRAGDLIFDPAAGAGDRLLSILRRPSSSRRHAEATRVQGVDPDATMVRLGVMSLVFHGVEEPDLRTRNVLIDPPDTAERFDVILCQPPFGNRIDASLLAGELRDLPPARSEVLFAELTLKRLAASGRAAIVLPAGLASSQSAGPLRFRRRLLERLRAVIWLPRGTFQPHANVETFIVAVGPPTSHVVFIDTRGLDPERQLETPDILSRSGAIVSDLLDGGLPVEGLLTEDRSRVFVVAKDEIRDNGLSLLPTTYQPPVDNSTVTDDPLDLFHEIEQTEVSIARHLAELGQRLAARPYGND
jgi:type I restriction enzyme M protein